MSRLLVALLALAVVRLWLMPLPSSFWADEANTWFVVHYPNHPSLQLSPQKSIYFALPRVVDSVAGFSEAAYRLPSTIALGVALFLIARLAARLIHPDAAWLAVFGCLALRGFDFQAADARPYALGMAVMAAALWFQVRWLDEGRWLDAALFVVFAALLWRVEPVYWPFYIVFGAYAVVRLLLHDTPVSILRATAVFAILVLALVPVLVDTLRLFHGAREHVISPPPGGRQLMYGLSIPFLLECVAAAWVLSRAFQAPRPPLRPAPSSLVLLALWWLVAPLSLFAFSWLTGISVFVPRYYSLALPGAALVMAFCVASFAPLSCRKPFAAVLGVCGIVLFGHWGELWPAHSGQDWRDAAGAINRALPDSVTPILCPSPFVEGKAAGGALPSVLYSPLAVYPVRGAVFPLPFAATPQAEAAAARLLQSSPRQPHRFFVYGHRSNAPFWEQWLRRRPELKGWTNRRLGPFGDVMVAEFDRGQ